MPRRVLRPPLALAVLAVGFVLAQSLLDLGPAALYLAPAVLLALPLLAGCYVGERQLTRLAGRVPPPRRRDLGARRPRVTAPRRLARGPRLIASSLAVRPPPAATAAI